MKEASGNLSQIADVCNVVPEDFLVFSGDDAVTLPVIALFFVAQRHFIQGLAFSGIKG